MLCRIPSLFLNDACIYSQDAILWHGVAGMSCFAFFVLNTFILSLISVGLNSCKGHVSCPGIKAIKQNVTQRFTVCQKWGGGILYCLPSLVGKWGPTPPSAPRFRRLSCLVLSWWMIGRPPHGVSRQWVVVVRYSMRRATGASLSSWFLKALYHMST